MSKVSVVIPCYNNYHTIARTYKSVVDQSFKDYNIIIVNDGSDQSTTQLINSFNNDKLQVIHQNNQGVVTARNNGIKAASSPYILCLDADDYFTPSFLEKAVAFLDTHDKYGVVSCNYQVHNEQGYLFTSSLHNCPSLKDLLLKNRLPANALFRKVCWEQVSGYDAYFNKGYEDWDFWINIAAQGWQIEIFEQSLLYIFVRSHSRNRKAMNIDIELRKRIFIKYKELYKDHIDDYVDHLFLEITSLKNTIRKRDNAIDMRVGRMLLKPLRFIKKSLKK